MLTFFDFHLPPTNPLPSPVPSRYMQQNCITAISHLDNTPNLDTLNVSSNPLASLEGLEPCQHLQTLIATHCKLSSMESVAPLLQCPSIQTLDLAANELKDPEVLSIFKNMPNLRWVGGWGGVGGSV